MAHLPSTAFAGAVTQAGYSVTADTVRRLGVLQGVGDGRYVIGLTNGYGSLSYVLNTERGEQYESRPGEVPGQLTTSEGASSGPFVLDERPYLNPSADRYANASPEMRGVIDNAKKIIASRNSMDIPLLDDPSKGIAKTLGAGIVKNWGDQEAERRAQTKQ